LVVLLSAELVVVPIVAVLVADRSKVAMLVETVPVSRPVERYV